MFAGVSVETAAQIIYRILMHAGFFGIRTQFNFSSGVTPLVLSAAISAGKGICLFVIARN
jgi:hypothetical protein